MITIFRGRKLSLQGAEEVIYAEVAVALRDQIHHFNTGKSCNPFAVFMKIALHTDENGWAFPGNRSISASTGISTAHALASARTHLQKVRIDGHRVLEVYRERRPDGTFGRHLYRIFPDAWTDGLEHVPATFDAEALDLLVTDYVGDHGDAQPDVDNPHVDDPHAEEPHADHPQHKKNQSMKDHQDQRSGSAGLNPTTTQQTSDEPLVEGQPPAEDQGTKAASAFTPCDLAEFIEAHSKYRFQPGGQHERLLHIVQDRDRQHPAPSDLYLNRAQREAFKAWVLTKIEWAEGETGRRKPLRSLVSAICNYAQPQFGWFAFWSDWIEQRQGAKGERGAETPGDPGRAKGTGGSPPDQESSAEQPHWAQVARFLANAGKQVD
ncbi:MAG: hypothetical protein GWN58_53515 [Anaerolineae bacterium]|nr:hypothetical protein [Anaerolineae bacterium]